MGPTAPRVSRRDVPRTAPVGLEETLHQKDHASQIAHLSHRKARVDPAEKADLVSVHVSNPGHDALVE